MNRGGETCHPAVVAEPPARIHRTHPFVPAEEDRDPVRRLRGRLAAPVTLWTAYAGDRPAGLTVSSVLVAEGDPALLFGVVGEESDLLEALTASGRFAVCVLDWEHRAVADGFAGVRPTPGGSFRGHDWQETTWGPVLAAASTWVGCQLTDVRPSGYARLVEGRMEEIVIGPEDAEAQAGPEGGARGAGGALVWRRGRYRRLSG